MVKWVGWEEATWEPEVNLAGSETLISDFQTSQAAGSKEPTVFENLTNGEKRAANPEEETGETPTTGSELLSNKDPMQLAENGSTDPCTSTDEKALASTFENHKAVEDATSVGQTETVNIGENMISDENGRDERIVGIGGKPNGTNYETDVSENPAY